MSVGIRQGFGRIAPHARFPKRHQGLAFGTELDDRASLVAFSGKLLELLRARSARVGHPHISIAIHVDAVRPHEHPPAKAPELLPGLVEKVDGVRLGAEAARSRPRRASIERPHRPAVAIDGHAIGAAPRPFLGIQLCPIADRAIRIGAAVDGLNLVSLSSASPLLRLHAGAVQRNPAGGDQHCQPDPDER